MSGGALSENVGFPSVSGWQTAAFPPCVDIIPRPSNHAFDFLFAHFNILEYPIS